MKRAWQRWVLALALGVAGAVRADYMPGTTNTVYADGTTGASYLLYLPTSYDTNQPPPLVLYFDPGANSGYGMSKLQPSCEAAGWVLACANELRNEWIPNQELKIREIMDDARSRIPHDRRRFYAAGLSGGAWRANSLSREYWNEVAGLLLFGCWIGDYDDYTVFPDRLAVARVNGLDDNSAIASEPYDGAYYAQTMVRVHDVHFAGGHEIGPTNAISEALAWLDADFAGNGVNYVSNDYETAASALVVSAQAAWDASQYDQVVSNAVAVMYRYPASGRVREAEQWLFRVMTNGTLRPDVSYFPDATDAWPISWMLMQRGLGTDAGFPRYCAQAYFETAILACPTNSRALAECAHQILNDSARSRSEWPLAAELAESAHDLRTNHWRASYVKYELAELLGDVRGALAQLTAAMDRIPADSEGALWNTHEACDEKRSRCQKYVSRIEALPLCDDFEQTPMDRSVVGRRGWMVSWGGANNQTQTVHNGLCALSITGRQSLAYFNFIPVTNQAVWLDFYVRPARAGCDFTNSLPPLAATAFQVQSNGLLRVYDGTTGDWTTWAHEPMPTDRWSRISIRADAANQQWAIWLNDQVVADGLGLAHSNSVFFGCCFLHDGDAPTYLDDLTVSTNPPAADRDQDGLPDAWEDFYELNASDPSDAGLDPDDDCYANCEEYRLTTSPRASNEPPVRPDYVGILVERNAGFEPVGMIWSNVLHRHQRWSGDVLLVATNAASMDLYAGTGGNVVFWGPEEATTLTLPATTTLEEDSVNTLSVQGPLNALYRVRFDGSTGELSVEWEGFHDADGDTMMDEWELLHAGSETALTPYGNPDGDAYPNLTEYFRNTDPYTHDCYSPYDSISVTGTFVSWYTTYCNMALVGDHVWQYRYWWGDQNAPLIKFVANHSWDVNWGDDSQTVTNASFRDVADLGGANIVMNVTNGQYEGVIMFDDATCHYAIVSKTQDADMDGLPDAWEIAHYTNTAAYGAGDDPDEDGRPNAAEYLEDSDPFAANAGITTNGRINVVGNFSSWNTALYPMDPAGNHLWRLDVAFTNQAGVEFKFVANGDWSTAWGATNSAAFALPLQTVGNFQGGAPNFKAAAPLDGVYRFTFNEACGLCTLDYAPHYLLHQAPVWTEGTTNRALVLKWPSSSDCFYALYGFTNLLEAPELLRANVRATPPLNVVTQEIDPSHRLGVFQVRLED